MHRDDIAVIHASGGVFRVDDPVAEAPRAAAFEISPTGPIFGTRVLEPGGAVAERERAVVVRHGIDLENLRLPPGFATGSRMVVRGDTSDIVIECNGARFNGGLGTLHDREDPRAFSTREILTGLALGMAILVGFLAVGIRSVNGLHAGTLAVAVNYGSVFLLRKFRTVIKNGDIPILWKTSGASGEGSN